MMLAWIIAALGAAPNPVDKTEALEKQLSAAIRSVDCDQAREVEAAARSALAGRSEPDAGMLAFRVSRAFYACGDYREALRVLEWVGEQWGDSLAGHVALGSAECWRRLGDVERQIEALERAAASKPRDTNMGLMDAGNTVSHAVLQLARLREERKEWKDALRLWESWKPKAWCGNELEAYSAERTRGIARAQAGLGRFDAAFETLASSELDSPLNGYEEATARLWMDLAREAPDRDARLAELTKRLYEITLPPSEDERVAEWHQNQLRESVLAALRSIGEPASAWLRERSREGDAHAQRLLDALANPNDR